MPTPPIRVVVAEDSLTVRELLVEILESDPAFQVIGQATTGAEAVDLATRLRPNLIAMDIHMPVMDGLEATQEIMVRAPTPIVLVSASVSRQDAALSFDALRAGALMILAKPHDPASPQFDGCREHFLAMLKAMAQVKVVRRWPSRRPRPPVAAERGAAAVPIRLVALAASTGGPAALQQLLVALPADFPVPIVVVQHIATGFVAPLAEWLNTGCNLRVKVVEHGERLLGRTVYLAPDNRHLGVSSELQAQLSDSPLIGGHRPSGTYLFESVARACGWSAAAVILTGMGADGVAGLDALKAAGGYVIAQDEATSVVYGMPGEAVAAGLADVVLPIEEIAPRLVELAVGGTDAHANSDR